MRASSNASLEAAAPDPSLILACGGAFPKVLGASTTTISASPAPRPGASRQLSRRAAWQPRASELPLSGATTLTEQNGQL